MQDRLATGVSGNTPAYTIKTVFRETGVSPASLRAWERRYRVLSPGRSEGGYRLYSEQDIAVLRWLKRQVDAGVTISRAVALLERQHAAGIHPELAGEAARPGSERHGARAEGARDLASIRDDLVGELMAFREHEAELILSDAFALHPVDSVIEQVVLPTLTEIGDRWQSGSASVAQEHFATAVLERRLMSIFLMYASPRSGPLALVGAAPGEMHEIGALLVSMALRRSGWRVILLGQNVPSEEWIDAIVRSVPQLVCISATIPESASAIRPIYEAFLSTPEPRPTLALGGKAFDRYPDLRAKFAQAVFSGSAFALPSVLPDLTLR